MSLKDDVKISINHLDQAAIEQPSMYAEWAEKWAEAVMTKDQLKEQITAVKAEADESIRANPKGYGWSADKAPTEAWVATQLSSHKKVVKITEDYLKAQYEVNMLSVAKEAFEHRRKALEILTTLYASNYFVAKSKSDHTYVEKLSEKGKEEVNTSLEGNERMSRRRRAS